MAGRGATVLAWQVPPAGTGAQHPEDAIEGAPVVGPGAATLLGGWQQWRNQFPLVVSQFSFHDPSLPSQRLGRSLGHIYEFWDWFINKTLYRNTLPFAKIFKRIVGIERVPRHGE